MESICIGLDLGGTNIKAGVIAPDGAILAKAALPTGVGPDQVLANLSAAARTVVDRAGRSMQEVAAVGVTAPGALSVARGMVLNAGNLPGFVNVPIRARLGVLLGRPTLLENDANAAAFGEFWLVSKSQPVQHLVLMTFGTGVGGGIVDRGTVLHGSHDMAAELGHMIIMPGGAACSCGQRGCLEAYTSASNIGLRAAEILRQTGQPSTLRALLNDGAAITSRDVVTHAREGDQFALRHWDEACRLIAIACVNTTRFTDPDLIVLGGGMADAGDFLLEPVRRHFLDLYWKLTPAATPIVLAQLGNDAGMVGAAGLAYQALRSGGLPAIGT